MPKKIDSVLRNRAVRLVRAHRSEYPSSTAVAQKLDVNRATLEATIGRGGQSPARG